MRKWLALLAVAAMVSGGCATRAYVRECVKKQADEQDTLNKSFATNFVKLCTDVQTSNEEVKKKVQELFNELVKQIPKSKAPAPAKINTEPIPPQEGS